MMTAVLPFLPFLPIYSTYIEVESRERVADSCVQYVRKPGRADLDKTSTVDYHCPFTPWTSMNNSGYR